MTAVLYVAARAPRPGFSKTRLGQAIGHDRANILYAAFVQDLAAHLAEAPFPVGWYVTPEDAWDELEPLIYPSEPFFAATSGAPRNGTSSAPPGTARGPMRGPVLVQGPGDWTARQHALFATAPGRGESRTILIASDSPQITLDPIVEAFEQLERHDLVLGPVDDGGYYLIGMRGPSDVLRGVPMSTRTVLDQIIARAELLGLSTALVAPTFDVDEAVDLDRLAKVVVERDDLPSTRAALAKLGWSMRSPEDASPVPV